MNIIFSAYRVWIWFHWFFFFFKQWNSYPPAKVVMSHWTKIWLPDRNRNCIPFPIVAMCNVAKWDRPDKVSIPYSFKEGRRSFPQWKILYLKNLNSSAPTSAYVIIDTYVFISPSPSYTYIIWLRQMLLKNNRHFCRII